MNKPNLLLTINKGDVVNTPHGKASIVAAEVSIADEPGDSRDGISSVRIEESFDVASTVRMNRALAERKQIRFKIIVQAPELSDNNTVTYDYHDVLCLNYSPEDDV